MAAAETNNIYIDYKKMELTVDRTHKFYLLPAELIDDIAEIMNYTPMKNATPLHWNRFRRLEEICSRQKGEEYQRRIQASTRDLETDGTK